MKGWWQRRRFGRLVREALAWLTVADLDRIVSTSHGWTDDQWARVCSVLSMHGIAPYLHAHLRADIDGWPGQLRPLQVYLEHQRRANQERIARMETELAAVLSQADRRGIPVMPLKGSLIGTQYYSDSSLRPMADIDLLVKSAHAVGLKQILSELGYQHLESDNPASAERHSRFLKPDNHAVVSRSVEHPDNPRPIEVHTNLERALWGDLYFDDVAAQMWSEARRTTLLGEAAWVPAPGSILALLAIHTLDHMMVSTARALHLLDLHLVSKGVQADAVSQLRPMCYLPLRLSCRLLQPEGQRLDLSALALSVDPHLRRWVEAVALDGSCGLQVYPVPRHNSRWWVHWERWGVSRWRLRIAYGRRAWPVAVLIHGLKLAGHIVAKLRPNPQSHPL